MKERKYELLKDDNITIGNTILYRIIALKNFGDVKIGDRGGYIEKIENLSHEGDCWIYPGAYVYRNAKVYENAKVYSGMLFNNIKIYGSAYIGGIIHAEGNVEIYGTTLIDNTSAIKVNNSTLCNVAIIGYNCIADSEIFNATLLECTITGSEDMKIIIDRVKEKIYIPKANIRGNVKINSKYDYGKICGLGLDTDIEFFKTRYNKIIVNFYNNLYFLDEFKQLIKPQLSENIFNAIINLIESTTL